MSDPTVPLPPGKVVFADEGESDVPAIWVSEGPATAELWDALRTGDRWPLLLESMRGEPSRPWDDGELWPADTSPDSHDAAALMAGWWGWYTAGDDEEDMLTPAERLAVTAPYGRDWPGLAPTRKPVTDPDRQAVACVAELLRHQPALRLGLVAADRGADALAIAGWDGATNYTETVRLSAVLRTWEDRFGVRVIGAGSADLYLSVAAPPTTVAEALPVAAEHFAFCPDNVWQGTGPLTRYAEGLVNTPLWRFWWD